ncbi:Oligopeptidase A [Flexistipes sinusarabici DSM 4947]|uniref:oligopeptidase A n=1 Tax=Flexistipes sinusarabici (strain ATCC 49648 / DSM 4947 / MAS 10) TaxID=717231 RepID=F8E627_FLESM|nr:M3 family metallopeptidase [Flexistipes sinusarabici]AEI14735.1 Oligopeptidase A [Flexistipes sinusarabici DSM 4947]
MDYTLLNENEIENFPVNFSEKLQDAKDALENLKNTDDLSYKNFIRPFADIVHDLHKEFTKLSHLNSVNNTNKTQEAYKNTLPMVTEFLTDVSLDGKIYQIYEKINSENNLSKVQKAVIEKGIRDFRLAGVHLPEKEKERVRQINLRLSELGNSFFQNILDDTDKFSMEVEESVLSEMPESEKQAAKEGDKYIFTLQMPSFIAFMTYCSDRKLREKMYKAFMTRAPKNEDIIEEILTLRYELSQILGFNNFAELSIYDKAAGTAEEVIEFQEDLAAKCKQKAQNDFAELQSFAQKYNVKNLQSYDLMYFSEKLKKEKLNFNEEELRPYFEKNAVIEGLFTFLQKLFNIEFKPEKAVLWHKKARCYKLYIDGVEQGTLFMDLEARKGKKDGAWMNDWVTKYTNSAGEKILPKAFIVANFPPSTETNPSLLRHRDVETLFHEMGHALHHLLSNVDEYFVSGVNGIEWDLVEFPSQLLENFAFEPEILKMFARHYKTGEIIPEKLICKIVDNKNFHSGMGFVRQLEFGLFDMYIHMRKMSAEGVEKTLDEVRDRVAVIKPPEYTKFQNQFAHIFAGGYAAGYYSYKWAERLSANAFYDFVNNNIFDNGFAQKFLDEVLSLGGSANFEDVYEKFSGKKIDNESLLKLHGII